MTNDDIQPSEQLEAGSKVRVLKGYLAGEMKMRRYLFLSQFYTHLISLSNIIQIQ